MDISSLRRIAFGLVAVIVLALAIVVSASASTRAQHESHRADATQADLTLAQGNLEETQAGLDATSDILATTRQRLTHTSRSLSHTVAQRDTLNHRMRACRYLIKVNDHLLYGMVAQQDATGQLLKSHPNQRAAKHLILKSGHHASAIVKLVKRAGYRNISALVNACSPPRR